MLFAASVCARFAALPDARFAALADALADLRRKR
jgi:hypothetical protein